MRKQFHLQRSWGKLYRIGLSAMLELNTVGNGFVCIGQFWAPVKLQGMALQWFKSLDGAVNLN